MKRTEVAAERLCSRTQWLNARCTEAESVRGEAVTGLRESALYWSCDRGEPVSDELISPFPVDEQFDVSALEAYGGVVAAWVEAVRHRSPGPGCARRPGGALAPRRTVALGSMPLVPLC
ncbi:DUF6300 family protein [Streptomyces sp. NPDC054864]